MKILQKNREREKAVVVLEYKAHDFGGGVLIRAVPNSLARGVGVPLPFQPPPPTSCALRWVGNFESNK